MHQRVVFFFVMAVVSFTFYILSSTQKNTSSSPFQEAPTYLFGGISKSLFQKQSSKSQQVELGAPKMKTGHDEKVPSDFPNEITEPLIEQQRINIRRIMKNYAYPNGKYNTSANKLEDLLIEENGNPLRSVIVTTWRSGSTFLGDVMNAHPATFFHQEPLQEFGIVQIRGPPFAKVALKNLRALFKCDYSNQDHFVQFLKKGGNWALSYNRDYWMQCKTKKDLCYSKDFFSAMCKLFPFQLAKLVRLTLSVAQELLTDEDLALRMVYLVRDPRGTLQSRKHREWCPEVRDCSDPALLCADMAADYNVAVKLQKKYPTRFRVVRYEDLSAEPYDRVEELSNFFGIGFHQSMKKFLDTHTKHNKGGPSSTVRDSKQAPYHWKSELTFEEITEIQKSCIGAMKHWGYLPAMNATHQKEFNSVTSYTLT